jgi:hypothetical protein
MDFSSASITIGGHGKMAMEVQMVARLEVRMDPELHKLLGKLADGHELPMSEYVVRLLAQHVKRADLAIVPRKKMGRPRKELASR